MGNFNSNILLALFAGIILIAIVYYLNRNNKCPIPTIQNVPARPEAFDGYDTTGRNARSHSRPNSRPAFTSSSASGSDRRSPARILRSKPRTNMDTVTGTPTATSIGAPLDYAFSENKFDDLLATDPYSSMASPRSAPNRGSNRSAIEACLSEIDDRSASEQEYIHKKKKYIRRTPKDAIDQFDPEALLPQDFEEDWFELPLLGSNTVKKVQSANLIHPKMHMGENTVNGSLRCATHDIRGDIPNPKIHVSPWLNSTIEPDTNIRGFCN